MEDKVAGRILLVFVLLVADFPGKAIPEVDAQAITFSGISMTIGNDRSIQERVPDSDIIINSVIGSTIAGGPTIAEGPGLWDLEVFLTDLTRVPRIDGDVVSFVGANTGLRSGDFLSLTQVNVRFDLETTTCSRFSLICATIIKGSSSEPFDIAQTNPTCQEIDCKGVVVSQVIPSITNRDELKQGERNELAISISLTASPIYGSVFGSGLTLVEVFASLRPDGTGIQYPAIVSSSVATDAARYGISGPGSTIPRIEATLDLTGVGCRQLSYVCVRVLQGPNPTPEYTLSFDPPEANVACKELTCRGLEGVVVLGTFLTNILGEYKRSHTLTISSITFTSNGAGGSVTSSSQQLWDLEVAVASAATVGSIYENTRVRANLQTGQAGQAFTAGGQLQFTSVTAVLNLELYECNEVSHVAVRLLKHPQSPADFTIASEYSFQAAECRGLTITSITVTESTSTSNNGFPLRERTANQDMVFDATFGTDHRFGSVRGNNLWEITVGISRVQSPSFASLTSDATAQLTQAQRDLDVEGGEPLILIGTEVTLSFNEVCASRNYFCVSISKSEQRAVLGDVLGGHDFQLSGQVVGCVEIICRGVEITQISLESVSPLDIEQHASTAFALTAQVSTNPMAGSGSTGQPSVNPWTMRIFFNSDPSLDLSISGSVNTGAESTEFLSGQTTSVIINSEVVLRGSCENMQFICLYIEQNVGAQSFFTFEENNNVQFGCTRISSCREVEIEQVTVTVDGSGIIIENSGSLQILSLALTASRTLRSVMMDPSGSDYWQVMAFGSQPPTGDGERIALEIDVGLTASQKAEPLGRPSDFGLITYEILTSDVDCSRLRYVCLELLKNTLQTPNPDFTLAESGIGCAMVQCVGVVVEQTTLQIISGGVRERADDNPVIVDLRMTTATVSAGVDGSNLWSLRMFTATQPDGTGLQQVVRELPQDGWSNAGVINGEAELNGIMLNFDLSTLSCAEIPYVCITVSKSSNPTPEFSLTPVSSSSLTGCTPIPCDGLEITATSLILSQQSGIVIEHSIQPVNVRFTAGFMSDLNHEPITGSNLWVLDVFLNDRPDGTGNQQRSKVTVTDLNGGQNQDVFPGGTFAFSDITASLPVADYVCPPTSYLCVQLQKHPERTFALSVTPPRCVEIECRGVLVTSVSVTVLTGDPFVEFAASHSVLLQIEMQTDSQYAGVRGERLWTYNIFLNPTNENSLIRIAESDGAYTLADEIVTAGQPFRSEIDSILPLSQVSCQDASYLCVIVSKGSDPSIGYTFEQMNENVLRACVPIRCQGVDLVRVIPTIINGSPFLEQSNQQIAGLSIELEFSQNTASVSGMNLWDAEVFLNPNNLGTGTRSATETVMGLNGNVTSGMNTIVDSFSVEFDISNRICSEVQYLCVRIRKHSMAVPNFLLNPEAGRLACVSTDCVGAVIENFVVNSTSQDYLREVVENRFDFVVSFDANDDNAGLSDFNGRDIWGYTLFTNDNPDGSGIRERESIVHRSGSIAHGDTLVHSMTFYLDLFNFLCDDGGEDYLCLELGPGPNRASDLSVTYPSPYCMPAECRGVHFQPLLERIDTSNSVMLEYTDNHVVSIGFQGNGNLESTTIENGNNARAMNVRSLWLVSLTGDNNPGSHTAFSPFYQEGTASLTPAQATTPFRPGELFEMSNVQARMNLTSFYCPPESYYLCIFLDRDPNSFPEFTFENEMRPTGCMEIECRGVFIQRTTVTLETSQFIRERQSNEEVAFNLEVTTDILSSSTSGQFLQFRTYISDDQGGSGNQFGESTVLLSSAQQNMDIYANEAVIYENLVATMDLAGISPCSDSGMFFCIEITKNPLSSRPFKLEGNLVGCTEIECRGVLVTRGTASPTVALPLREGSGRQSVQIDVMYSAAVDYASIFGQNLWQIIVFASSHPNGQELIGGAVTGMLGNNGVNLPLIAGRSTVFSVSAVLDLGDTYQTCSELQYVCGTLNRDPTTQAFGFVGQPPSATTACARFECIGVVITQTELMVSQGLTVIENNPNFPVIFTVNLNVDFTSSTLAPGEGNRWRFEVFGNSRADGLGERISPREAVLQNVHLRMGVQPGIVTEFIDVTANLDLTNQYCSTLQFLCVEVSRPIDADPLFSLTGLHGEPQRLIGCQSTNCIGVRITGGTLSVPDTTRLTEGLTMDSLERIDVTYQSDASGAGASGVDLWTLEVFLATSADGLNPTSNVAATLVGTAGSQPLFPGGRLDFLGTSAVLDTTNLQCSNFPHICVTLGGNPNRRFSLNGYDPATETFNDNILTVCSPITCDGVVIASNDVAVIQPMAPIYAREDNFFCFDVTLTFDEEGGGVVGSNLWEITAFMSQNDNGDPEVQSSEVMVNLTDDQRSLSAVPGNTAAFDNLKANLSLAYLNCPSGMAYLCVRINSNPESMPSFSVSGRVVGCAPVQCTGLMIESSSVMLVDPDHIRENTADQSVRVDITLILAQNSADFVLAQNLWQSIRIYTADADGNQRGSANTLAILTTEQSRTSLRRGQAAIIRGVFFTGFSTMRSQCRTIPYFCVTLENDPSFSVEFLDNSRTACAHLPCRGVEILEVTLEGDGPAIIERNPSYNLVLNVLVESDVGGAGISGTSLWTLYAFFDTQQDCQGNSFPGTRTQNMDVSNMPLVNGQTLFLRNSAFLGMNLQNLLCPAGPLYLCVEFDKLPNSNPPFTLTFVPDESTKYASVVATCQGVEVDFSILSVNSATVAREGDPSHDFNINFFATFASTSATVTGTNLWELVIYGSRDERGINSQEFLTTIPISNQFFRNQAAQPSVTLFFNQQLVTVDLRGVRCANYPFVCVKLNRNLASNPEFTFSGDEGNRIDCQPLSCAGILIETFVAGIATGTVIYENTLDQEIRTSLTIQSDPNAAPAVGNNFWRPFIFFNDNVEGNGPAGRISLTEMTIEEDDRREDLPPGTAVIFHPATATVDFTTSCSIGNYMCFEIFNGMDLTTPTYTLLGNVLHCFDVDCIGLIIADTSLQIQVGSTLREGAPSHQVTFVVTVLSSPTGVGATLSPMWEVRAFLANRDNSDGIVEDTVVAEATVENVLSASQRVMPISEGASVNFNGVQASFVIEGLVCEDTQYLCVEFDATEGSDHSVTPLNGERGRLIDCARLSCTGIEVVSSGLQLLGGEPLISNGMDQELVLSFEFITSSNSIALEGQRLFRIRIFPNSATDGSGVTPLDTNVEVELNQFTSIQPGTPNNFENLFVTMSLEGVRCDQMPYMCGTLLKGTSPSPEYTLQPEAGSPVLTACTRMLTCVGIQITEFDVTVSSGLPVPEDADDHTIFSMINVSSSPDGGSVTGLNLWSVMVFMSTTPDGQGERFFGAEANIAGSESAALQAGGTLEIDPVVLLALDGFSCSATRYLCYEFARSDAASVDFTLEAAPTLPNGLINCQEFLCRGVTFEAVSFTINSNQGDTGFRVFELDRNFQVSLNIDVVIGSESVSVSGTNLWEVTVFLSNTSEGTGPRLGESLAALTSEQGETSINTARTSRITNVLANLDLMDIKCDQFQYLCVEVWNGDNAIPRYRVDNPASPEDLRQCQAVSCAGVEILSVELSFREGAPILLDRTSLPQTVTFDLEIEANPFGAGVEGTDLWQVEAYILNEDDFGSNNHQPPASSLVIATLPQSEVNKALQTSETFRLEQVAADLVLSSRTCDDIAFLCATLQKGPFANPDFDIQPSVPSGSLTGCASVECVDAVITGTTMIFGPPSTLERDPAHTITMNITAQTSTFGRVITTDGLWTFTVFGSNGNPGETNTPLVNLQDELTLAQRNEDFLPSTQLVFRNVEATLDLQTLGCEELTHFCVQIGFVEGYELRGVPDESSLIACSPVNECGEFEVNLRVTSVDENSIGLAWSGGIGDFDFYEISYTGLSTPFSFPRFGNTRTLALGPLTSGREYVITIRLKKQEEFQEGSVTITQRTLPEQVAEVEISDVDSQSIVVTWTPVGGEFDSYVVRIEPGGGSPSSPHTVGRSVTSLVFTNLVIATAYTVTVVSRSEDSESIPTEATGFTTPTMPMLRVVEFTATAVYVEWTAPAGYTPSRYRLSYSSTPTNLRTEVIDARMREFVLENLVPTTQYDIELVAEVVDDSTGTVAASPSSSAIVTTGPDKPEVVVTSDINSISITVSLNRGTAEFYRIDYRPTFSPTISRLELRNITSAPVTVPITDLPSATTYVIDVVSIYKGVESDLCRITQSTRVEEASNLVIDSVTSSSITFGWQGPISIQLDDYRINITYGTNMTTDNTVSTTYTADNLPAYTDILISVEVRFNGGGTNIYSLPISTRQRTSSKPPGPVRNAEISQVGTERRILLTFEIPEMPNGELEAFIITNTKLLNDVVQSVTTSTITVASQENLDYSEEFSNNIIRGCSYEFTVTARNQDFDGETVTTNTIFISQIPPNVMSGTPLQPSDEGELSETTLHLEFVPTDISPVETRDIQNYTIIVAELGQPVEGDSINEPLPRYDENPEGPYQAFRERDWPTDGIVTVELGTDRVCGSFTYCNGPLKPDTTYLVAIRVYNERGYDTSDFQEFRTVGMTTAAPPLPTTPPPESTLGLVEILIIVSAAIGLLLLIMVFVVILLCVCFCPFCSCRDDESNHHSSKGRRRQRYDSDSESEGSGQGLDNINLNNATVLVYNPEDRNSSAASMASRLEGGIITRPVPINEFATHVGRLSANSQEGFELEFESLHDFGVDQSTSVAVTKENKAKNRFSNILPYNNSRVVLHGDEDYINASFITGSNRLHEFIATQGPMEHTVNDFWRMIWEQQVPIIVMICDIVEGGKTKCEEYWPPLGEPTACGEIRVTMLSEKQTTKGKEREFKLEIGEHSRTVSHFQFLEWPDKGVPSDTQFFTLFVKDIRSRMKTLSGPVVIHCSDGASRTGVFIALDILMQGLANQVGTLDVYGIVGRLRQERVSMVLSKNYYVFLHQAILDILLAQVSDSNWSYGPTTSHRYDYAPLEDSDLLGAESTL